MSAQSSSFTLAENVERDDELAPHLSGTIVIDQRPHEAAAWLKQTKNGDPMVSLSLRPAGDGNGQKINIPLWSKKNRTKPDDPHFRVSQAVLDVNYSISGFLTKDPATDLFSLRIEFEAISVDELNPRAKIRHDDLQMTFDGFSGAPPEPKPKPETPPAPASRFARAAAGRPTSTQNPLDEPDDIPF